MADKPLVIEVVTKGASKAAKQLGSVSDSALKVATSAGQLATAGLAAGAAVGAMVDDIVGSIDEMNTFAQSSGLSIQTIEGLKFAADATGKSLQDLVPVDLAKKMRDARMGSKGAQEAFEELGISMEELESMTPDEAFRRVLDGLDGIDDKGRKAGVAAELLGEKGRQMLSAFEGSESLDHFVSQAEKFGLDVGPDAVAAASEWQTSMHALTMSIETLKGEMQPLVGPMAKGVRWFAIGSAAAFEILGQHVDEVGLSIAKLQEMDFEHFLAPDMDRIDRLWDLDGVRDFIKELDGVRDEVSDPEGWDMTAGLGSDSALWSGADADAWLEKQRKAAEGMRSSYRSAGNEATVAVRELKEETGELIDLEAERHARAVEAMEAKKQALLDEVAASEASAEAFRLRMVEEQQAAEESAQAQAQAKLMAFDSIASASDQLTSFAIENMNTETKAGRDAAMALFAVKKAVGISEIVVSTAISMMKAMELGVPVGPIVAATMAVTGGIQAAVIAAEKPKFHVGTRAADEVDATLRRGEVVLSPTAADAVRQTAGSIPDLQAGVSTSSVAQLYLGREAMGRVTLAQTKNRRSVEGRRSARRRIAGRKAG